MLKCLSKALLAVVLPVLAAHAATILVSDPVGSLAAVDVATGRASMLGTLPVLMGDIAFSPSGVLYGVSLETTSRLFRINPASAAALAVGIILPGVNINALAFRNDGTLFGAGGTTLYRINPHTGAGAPVGNIGFTSAGDLAFDASGHLFLSATETPNSEFVRVNPVSGASTLVGNTGSPQLFAMDFAGGILYGFSNSRKSVFRIDPASGASTFVANLDPRLKGAFGAAALPASFTAQVPEPDSLGLLAGALAILLLGAQQAIPGFRKKVH